MALEAHLWTVEGDRLTEVEREHLDLEDRLEKWLCDDISVLGEDLLVIGRQIQNNEYGGVLDLLAVDREGNLVIIELKRDRTPREVVAQALDYASWVYWLDGENLEQYARKHLGKSFDEAFQDTFDEPPKQVNERQRIYIVASSLDASTQRIVDYLAGVHDVDINAATFSYFKVGGGEFVARSMLRDDEEVPQRRARGSRRFATKTLSARVEESQIVVGFPEDGLEERWELPEPSDREAIRQIRKEAFAFVRSHGATTGQVNAVGKALSDNGYRVRG